MNVLLVGMGNKKLLIDLHHNLVKEKITADLLDPLEGYFIDASEKKWIFGKTIVSKNFFKKNIQLFLNFYKIFRYFRNQNSHYDVCNIHFLDPRYFFFKKRIFKLCNQLVVSVYGSDFYLFKKYDFFQKPFYKTAARITFANDKTRSSFDDYYNNKFSHKLNICRFGLSLLPLIKDVQKDTLYKEKALSHFSFPDNKIIITIGYHSNPITQQVPIINELLKISNELKTNIFVVLPMAYGGFKENINKVDNLMKSSGISYCIIRDFLNIEDLLKLRIASDIMINLPTTDQLSATLCEYLFTKNWVITGAWLPYETIDQTGVHYHRIQGIDELSSQLTNVLEHFSDYQQLAEQNPDRIWHFSSWSHNITSWIEVYKA